MQTQCPHCDTRFRVTDSQLNSADGVVRCGVCEHVFNAHESNDPTAASAANPVDCSGDEKNSENTSPNNSEEQLEPSHLDSSHQKPSHLDYGDTEQSEDTSAAAINIEGQPEPEVDSTDHNEQPLSDDPQKDTYNFFEDDHDDETNYVVPREFCDSHETSSPSTVSTVLLGIGAALLITTFFIQYAWYNRNEFIHIPEIQAKIVSLCQHFDCTEISFRAPAKIELVSRNIYSHPNEKEALMINLTIKNNATFSQPYPMMSIDFTDIRGDIVASRVFSPQEYLYAQAKQDSEMKKLIPPDSSSDIMMEMQDPGMKALTYEFNFL